MGHPAFAWNERAQRYRSVADKAGWIQFQLRKGFLYSEGRIQRIWGARGIQQRNKHDGGIISMAKYALYVALKAKPGKAAEVEAFLKQGAEMAKAEKGTLTWYGIKEDDGAYAVFDTFDDEAGRDAHLNGDIAKALTAKAEELFSNKLEIHKIQVIASK
jgi:quinol monooxygenase YgiN